MVIGRPGKGTLRSLNASVKFPTFVLRLTSTVEVAVAVCPAVSVEVNRTRYCPFSRTVGSKVPKVPLFTAVVPEAKGTNVVGLPEPSSREYSSFQLPLLTEPMMAVGVVISAPSANPVKLTTGGGRGGTGAVVTVIVICEVDCNWPSVAKSCTV